jgi:photosystem II stability/assembly factor-like uncharacterized protein
MFQGSILSLDRSWRDVARGQQWARAIFGRITLAVAEPGDPVVVRVCREHRKRRAEGSVSESADGGQTWTASASRPRSR